MRASAAAPGASASAPRDQAGRPGGVAEVDGQLGGPEQPADGRLAVRAELRGAGQRARGGGRRPAPAGVGRGRVEVRGDGLVRAGAGGRPVPGAPVRIGGRAGEPGVRGPALGGARGLVGGRADQRVAEPQPRAVALQ